MREEESFGARYSFIGNNLNIRFNIFNSEFDGNDFAYDYYFDSENTEKLLSMFGLHNSENAAGHNARILCARFGENAYASDLKEYCIEHGIHFSLHDYEDYPGGLDHWYYY